MIINSVGVIMGDTLPALSSRVTNIENSLNVECQWP